MILFLIATYYRVFDPDFDVRLRPHQSAPVRTEGLFQRPTVVILHREQTRPQDPSRRSSETFGSNSSTRIFVVARQQRGVPLSDKGPRSAGPGRSPQSNAFLTDIMDTDRELTDITDRKPRTPGYKYSFRLNEEQNIRFNELLCKAGLEHNRNRFSNFG